MKKKVEKPKGNLTMPNEIWGYLLGYFEDNKFMPTLEEIAIYFNNINGTNHGREWARHHLKQLVKDGRVRIDKHKTRGIKLIIK